MGGDQAGIFWLGENVVIESDNDPGIHAGRVYVDNFTPRLTNAKLTALEGANPYEGGYDYLGGESDSLLNAYGAYVNVMNAAVGDFVPASKFRRNMDTVKGYLETNPALFTAGRYGGGLNQSMKNAAGSASSKALTQATAAIGLASTARANVTADSKSAENSSNSTLQAADLSARDDISNVFAKITASIHDVTEGYGDSLETPFEEARDKGLENAKEVFKQAETEIDTDVKYMVETAIENLIANSTQDIQDIFDKSLVAASTVLTDADALTIMTDMVGSYESKATPALMRAYNRFAGTAVDINSVHGSGFLIGMSNIERGFSQDLEKFRSDLHIEIFKKVHDQYIEVFTNTFNQYIASYIGEKQLYAETYSKEIPEYLKLYTMNYTTRLQQYLTHLTEYVKTQKTVIDAGTSKEQLYITSQLDIIKDYVDNFINGHIKIKALTHANKDHHITSTALMLGQLDSVKVDKTFAQAEMERIYQTTWINTKMTEADKKYMAAEKEALWEFDSLTRAANVLAMGRASGSLAETDNSLGRIVGATIGAGVGFYVGGPPGAVAGANIGAEAGGNIDSRDISLKNLKKQLGR